LEATSTLAQWFSAVLVINRVSILADFGHFGHRYNRVWFLHSSFDMGMFLRRGQFLIIIEKEINKSPSQIMFTIILTVVCTRELNISQKKKGFEKGF